MRSIPFVFVILFVTVPPSLLNALTIHVPADSSTIQSGINGASEGDTVLVSAGTYYETINFRAKGVVVRSAEGPLNTTINGEFGGKVYPTVAFKSGEDSTSILEGFTVIKGSGSYEPGILCETSSPVIQNNIVIRSSTGIFCEDHGNPTIVRNYIGNNSSGIWCNVSSPLVEGNFIVHNSRGMDLSGWGTPPPSSPEIRGNMIGWNKDPYGDCLPVFSSSTSLHRS